MTRWSALLGLALLFGVLSARASSAHPGIGIVVDSQGNVFYTDLKQVWKIAPDGTQSIAVPRVHTHELYLDPQDNLFGEHLWYEGDRTGKWGHRVWKLSRDGELEDVIPSTEGFLTDTSFVRDDRGNMYWAGGGEGDGSNRVYVRKRAPDGTLSILAGEKPGRSDGVGRQARFTDIRWIAASHDGTVYAIDAGALRRIEPDGTVTTMASDLVEGSWRDVLPGNARRHALMGLCPDPQGAVYVANTRRDRVEKVSPNGEVSVFAECPGPYSPTGVTVTPAGDVYILECRGDAARVRQIRADGSERIF